MLLKLFLAFCVLVTLCHCSPLDEKVLQKYDKKSIVQDLLRNFKNCTIKNRRFEEFLYANGDVTFDRDSDRRSVFTWVSGDYDLQSLWTLEKSENDENVYKIKSDKFDEYFYAGADDLKYDEKRRSVFTWKPKTPCEEQCYWHIELVDQPAGALNQYFTIRNTEYGEYFFAFDDGELRDAPRRRVFTWKFDPNHNVSADYQSHWGIYCD